MKINPGISKICEPEQLHMAQQLLHCNCVDGRFLNYNLVFATVSDDILHNVVLTNGDNQLQEAICDCNFEGICSHILAVYLDFTMQAANYPTLDTIFAQIDNLDEKTVKNWVKQTLLHHPSIILHYPVKKPSHKQHNIIQEIKTVISTINRGGTLRSDTINNISGIFISEAMNHEHMGHYNEAVEIYQTLYDELQKILLEYHISPHEIPIMATARERQKNLIQKILKSANSSTNSEITTNRKVS